ncbi:TonB-dependent receptor [Luteimonas saliphila]|uniref:TonB-dependent receptor n=1 Tax=Luteimonas saliphila TaxID=2804919 RepID=UPI00192DBB38|nr:TonB-dependent receptor [Luteimonas saliphila]
MNRKTRASLRIQRSVLAGALASCLALTATVAHAQSASATLRGRVAGAEDGTTVTATNTADGSVRRTQTNADGSYTLVGLAPGTYNVEAEGGGAQIVRLQVASTSTLNLSADTGVAETPQTGDATNLDAVVVTAPALQEVNTSEVGKFVSLREIQNVPQSSRNFLEFADAVPGMIFERDGNGRTTLKGGAQNASSTNLYIDGVGQKSYVKKGGVAGQFDSAGNPFPQMAIGEYKVITSNYKAEYGQISSAAVTAVTRSGGNEMEGEVFYRFTDEGMREKTPAEEASDQEKKKSKETEAGIAVGGPLIEDKLHFFAAIETKEFALPTAVVPGVIATPEILAQLPVEARQFGPTSQPFDETLIFAKIDWNVTDNDHIAFSAQRRDEETVGNVGNQNAYSHGIYTDNYDHRNSLRWEHSADRWFNEVLLTSEKSFNNPLPITFGNGYLYRTPDGTNDATVIQVGGGDPRAGQVKGQKGWSIEDNLTFVDIEAAGYHTIKMGARYKSVDLYAADALNANPQFAYILGADFPPDQPYQAIFAKPVTGIGSIAPSVETTSKQYGLYIQDDWQVNDHLILNIGLRWDYEEVPAYLDFVTPQNVVDALNGQDPNAPAGQTYADSLRAGGVDINDYISTGNNREAFKDAWQPRLGFSYDFGADQKRVLYGGAGRSYDRNVYDFLQLEVTKSALPQLTINFRDPVTGECYRDRDPCFDWDPSYLNGIENLQALVAASNEGVEVDLMNNDLKTPYSDQYSLGMRNTIGQWLTDAAVTRIESHDGFAFSLGNRYPNGDFFQNGSQPWGNAVPGFGALIIGNNGIETKSTQLLLSAQKPYTRNSGWGTSFAYTFTDAEQNRDINEHYSFDYATPGDYPVLVSNSVPKHRFVATGTLDGFWGITFGGKLVLATPTPVYSSTCLADGVPTPVGGGRCMPAATEPDGTWGYRSLDLQATREFDVDGVRFYGRVDVLNVFNWNNYTSVVVTDNRDGTISARYLEGGNITGVPRMVKVEFGMRF